MFKVSLLTSKVVSTARTYRIDVNGTTIASHETPDGSDKSHTKLITTDYIAQQLATKAKDNGFAVTTGSSWLYLKKTAFKTVTGETVYLQPTTSPIQQEDRFKGLAFTGHFHTWSAFPTVITRNGYTITVKFPTEENLRANSNESFDSDYTAYKKMMAEITRCQNDKWKVTNKVITQQANGLKLDSTMNVYTLTWTVSTSIPSNSKAYSLIDSATVYDGYNNQAAFGILKFVQKFSNLPVNAPDGFTVKNHWRRRQQYR